MLHTDVIVPNNSFNIAYVARLFLEYSKGSFWNFTLKKYGMIIFHSVIFSFLTLLPVHCCFAVLLLCECVESAACQCVTGPCVAVPGSLVPV